MPENVNIASRIGRNRATAIEPACERDEVALRLEAAAGIIEARVPHRDPLVGSACHWLRPIPRDMHAAIPPEREVCAANGSGGISALLPAIVSSGAEPASPRPIGQQFRSERCWLHLANSG